MLKSRGILIVARLKRRFKATYRMHKLYVSMLLVIDPIVITCSSSSSPAFSESTSSGGTFSVMAAGESGVFSTVREGIEAGGRPVESDGLQTFGGVRALARYVQIEVVPASGGAIVINEASCEMPALISG